MKKWTMLAILALLVAPVLAQTPSDGPATLPLVVMEVRESFTLSSNYPKFVGPTDSLVTALATAVPGDRFVVSPSNTTTVKTTLTLPSGNCVNGQYITIESAEMPFLPSEGTRVNPTFASHMPKIVMGSSSASIMGGACVVMRGFEVTRPAGTGIVYNLFRGLNHDIILSRDYVHGTTGDETNRGVYLSDSQNVAIVDSYFADFHCLASVGACGDSQAIAGGASLNHQDGNYLIRNNYLEAAGENILLGGGPGNFVPCDITVQFNTMNKPMSWNPSDPSYAPIVGKDGLPHPWIVKNNFELKNGCRVLVEGNRMTNTWGGFTQVGAAILLTPKNPGSAPGVPNCVVCSVTNVTIRYNYDSFASQALQLGCGTSDNGTWPAACGNDSIHDNLFDHLQYPTCYSCGSFEVLIGGGKDATLTFSHLYVQHNTFQNDGYITANLTTPPLTALPHSGSNAFSALVVGDPNPSFNDDVHFDSNVFDPGGYGMYSTGGGVTNNCMSQSGSIKVRIPLCWGPNSTLTGNAILQQSYFHTTYLPWTDGNIIVPVGGTIPATAGANMTLVNAALANAR